MKVFLDVGAHTGETLRVTRDSIWGFDSIFCFEPAPPCWSSIRGLADERVTLLEFGLWNRDERLLLHNAGQIGASLAEDKGPVDSSLLCEFRDAATWFIDHVRYDDEVYMKINAEGAEADIIDRLSDAGQLDKIDHLLVHFDVRKVPSLRHLEARARQQLLSAGVPYLSADEIEHGGVYRGTRNWLRWCAGGRGRDVRFKTVPRLGQRLRRPLYPVKRRLLGTWVTNISK